MAEIELDPKAPARLWLGAPDSDGDQAVWFDPDEGGTAYVRSDLAASRTPAPPDIEGLVEELEAGLEGVTEGPWEAVEIAPDDKEWGAHEIMAGDDFISTMTLGPRNAAHIARCSPVNIRKLIAALRSPVPTDEALVRQIDALLAINKTGQVTHRIPGLAVELLERSRAALAHTGKETLADAEARIMQEYRWGNLTPLGVANHLKRAGFRSEIAVEKANALQGAAT